ncbi:hypothetical protein P4S91_15940, partial [Aneurinibacillus aneurinilyticus]|nr:hypothetical protein [Aneurinibacillus aneurinilyticus]
VLLYHDCDNIRLRLTEIHLPLSLVLSPSRLEVGDFFRREVKIWAVGLNFATNNSVNDILIYMFAINFSIR